MALQRVAVVTGGNKGIGLEICRQLAQQDIRVLLTARDPERGEAAAETLRQENLPVQFRELDTSALGIFKKFVEATVAEFGRIDILVNNAGIMLDKTTRGTDVTPDVTELTLRTNTLGPLHLTQAVAPVMTKQRYGRVVNLSSQLGQLDTMAGGYPAYRISKAGLNAVSRILAAELKPYNILVNSMCPGWVKTDMGGEEAPRSVQQGADTAVWLATLEDDGPTGGYFRDRAPMAW